MIKSFLPLLISFLFFISCEDHKVSQLENTIDSLENKLQSIDNNLFNKDYDLKKLRESYQELSPYPNIDNSFFENDVMIFSAAVKKAQPHRISDVTPIIEYRDNEFVGGKEYHTQLEFNRKNAFNQPYFYYFGGKICGIYKFNSNNRPNHIFKDIIQPDSLDIGLRTSLFYGLLSSDFNNSSDVFNRRSATNQEFRQSLIIAKTIIDSKYNANSTLDSTDIIALDVVNLSMYKNPLIISTVYTLRSVYGKNNVSALLYFQEVNSQTTEPIYVEFFGAKATSLLYKSFVDIYDIDKDGEYEILVEAYDLECSDIIVMKKFNNLWEDIYRVNIYNE